MKLLKQLMLILVLISLQTLGAEKVKVAMLISGYGEQGNQAISYDLEELAQSYLVLSDNNVTIDIITPEGGPVTVKKHKDDLEFIQRFKTETSALTQLNNTIAASDASPENYQGLFIVGGDGAMFDLPFHPATQTFISHFVLQNKVLAAVCHGPAALVNQLDTNGAPFVSGKKINGFTLKEEQAFSAELLESFPFMLQTALIEKGALFQSSSPMLPHVASDGNLITGQNPMSVAKAAELMLVKLGITPIKRALFKDEATLDLIAKAKLQGAALIDIALAKEPKQYDMNYLALYGFYAYRLADTPKDKQNELAIKEKISEYFSHPKYAESLIGAYVEQGMKNKARSQLKSLQVQYPKHKIDSKITAMFEGE